MAQSIEEMQALLRPIAEVAALGRYSTLAALVFLFYDYLISLDREIALFWLKPWSYAKILYFFNRYATPIFISIHTAIFLSNSVSGRVCKFWFQFEGWTGMITLATVESILAFRVYALWSSSKVILVILCIGIAAQVTVMGTILGTTYTRLDAFSEIIPGVDFRVCVPKNIPDYFFAFWLPPLGFETLACGLALWKGWSSFRAGTGNAGGRLTDIVIRDSILYFLVILAIDFSCSMVWLKGPDALLQATAAPGLAIPSVLSSHLLLNLREAYYHPNGTSAFVTDDLEMVTFRVPGRTTAQTYDTKWAMNSKLDSIYPLRTQNESMTLRSEIEDDVRRLEDHAQLEDGNSEVITAEERPKMRGSKQMGLEWGSPSRA